MLDFDEDEKSPKISLATIMCTRKTCKEEESRVHNKVIAKKRSATIYSKVYSTSSKETMVIVISIWDEKPMILLATIIGKMEPRTLKLKGSIKNKNITILIDSGSTHNFVDINLAKQLNLFVYLVKDLIVKVVDGQQVKGIGRCHKVFVQIQSLELQTGCYANFGQVILH
jgi:hypothetical protein